MDSGINWNSMTNSGETELSSTTNIFFGKLSRPQNSDMTQRLNKILEECFRSRRGKRPEIRRIPLNKRVAARHLDKAHNNLNAMRFMFNNEFYDWTVICGYYAMYHAILASLNNIGLRAFTHQCAISAFQKFFIFKGIFKKEYMTYLNKARHLEKKYSDSLTKAREKRVTVQYGVQIITNEDVDWILEEAEDFVLGIEELLVD
jgi:uncharacterized protein (UPF0332 family)